MSRFIVVDYDEAKQYADPNEYLEYYDANFSEFLVDKEKGEVIFTDKFEPEDGSLSRALYPLVELLNEVTQKKTVILAKEKHGDFVYGSALELLEKRIKTDWMYSNWDEDGKPEYQWEDRAKEVLATGNEKKAWDFLDERSDHEYEYVEQQEV